jgi:hypothetical protein
MANLNDLLRDQGIEYPSLLSSKQKTTEQAWTSGQAFVPVIGAVFEVDFGAINYRGRQVNATATVRIDGESPAEWFDLDEGQPLSEDLRIWTVKRFRTSQPR